jgi:hypothetical protein
VNKQNLENELNNWEKKVVKREKKKKIKMKISGSGVKKVQKIIIDKIK